MKPKEILYTGSNPCLTVIYRVLNDGPAAVQVNGFFLDPGTSVDVTVLGAGAAVSVGFAGQPKCPAGSHVNEQLAAGSYDLVCCQCCPPVS